MPDHSTSEREPAWGLEYLLLFGPPENKIELLGGYTPCSFPFADRETGEHHFAAWAQQLARLSPMAVPRLRKGRRRWRWEANGFTLTLHKRPIQARVPVPYAVYDWAHECFFRPELWNAGGAGRQTGWRDAQDHWDIKSNVWRLFEDASDRLPGWGIGGVDVSLSATDTISPDHSFYRGDRRGADFAERTIGGQYFKGPPDLVVEVFSDYSRSLDRGPRMEVCRRNGVPRLWHLDPADETLDAYELRRGEYDRVAAVRAGNTYRPDAFPGLLVDVTRLFDTQSKHHGDHLRSPKPEPEEPHEEWGVPEDEHVGLEHLLLLGHAERRREIWNNRAPCRLAFASEREASFRLARFLADAAAWEGRPAPPLHQVEPGVETAEVGRFRFVRRGRCVHVDFGVDGVLYRQLLQVCADRSAWDWGDR